MPNYLRSWHDRTILVRPTKWDGAEEVPPWDCLDITECRRGAVRWGQLPASHFKRGISHDEMERIIGGAKDVLLSNFVEQMAHLIRENPSHYRSRPFCKKNADNPRMNNPYFGCCVAAAEALYFLIPDDKERTLYRAKDKEGIYHWWAQHTYTSGGVGILDATHTQFSNWWNERNGTDFLEAPYDDGKKISPMGWKQSPSKRTLDLIADTAELMKLPCERYRADNNSYKPPSAPGTLESFLD